MITTSAVAGMLASSTRIIFQDNTSRKTLLLANTNDYPVLVQTWVDDGENSGTPGEDKYPFVAIPAIFQSDAKSRSNLELIYNGTPLPDDRESVFWLNLYEIPAIKTADAEKNKVLMAMNTQLKIFYRPVGLNTIFNDRLDALTFSYHRQNGQDTIVCRNPTPYYISLSSLSLIWDGQYYPVTIMPDMMVAPFGEKTYTIASPPTGNTGKISAEAIIIDDNGNSHTVSRLL
ncbi:molecular chaperone [Morganella psychrotolerans]|uniref:fimbrial biogenesis chaperone n=1 Tax=Morganella psychrotolerans TaxID=368603 RepID=UPI0039AF3A45